jgi:hypothetical protein
VGSKKAEKGREEERRGFEGQRTREKTRRKKRKWRGGMTKEKVGWKLGNSREILTPFIGPWVAISEGERGKEGGMDGDKGQYRTETEMRGSMGIGRSKPGHVS